uniref:Uncharacterized protein n=1 Tax=Utricularia reniformis TaxID=192314 RepID=A0A1Y0AYP0_9LAMI|nr:hypothetical protein AEK19_MT0315 [Utricularia reniformis]ART30272.1 hypothetical protein AEK19_MT0315 [Utricularia reniformis]
MREAPYFYSSNGASAFTILTMYLATSSHSVSAPSPTTLSLHGESVTSYYGDMFL